MAISFHPVQGTILMCNFAGFQAPEMVKTRPVIILSRHRTGPGLSAVVPISTTEPRFLEPWHVEVPLDELPASLRKSRCWVKCDMVYTLSDSRLDRVRIRHRDGRRVYVAETVSNQLLIRVKDGVRAGLGL